MSAQPRALRVALLAVGPDEYAAAMARALSDVADVMVIASDVWSERYGPDLPSGVRLCPLPWPRHRDPRGLVLACRVLSLVTGFRPHVVHFLGDSIVWLVLALPFIRRYALVVTVHDIAYHPGDVQASRVPVAGVRLLRRAADALIVHGDSLRRELLATGVQSATAIHAVSHPVLDRHARLAGAPDQLASGRSRRLLFFGRVMAYKGLAVLIDASDQLIERFNDLEIVVAGSGPELDRLAPELARRPWFEVRNAFVPDAAVAGLFRTADLLVLPYTEASQSGVAAIAAAFGTAVVATDVGELGELVRASGMGLVVPPGDAPALAEAIARLLDDQLLRQACAAAARGVASGPMAPAAVAARTLEVYGEAGRRRGTSAGRAGDAGKSMRAGGNTNA